MNVIVIAANGKESFEKLVKENNFTFIEAFNNHKKTHPSEYWLNMIHCGNVSKEFLKMFKGLIPSHLPIRRHVTQRPPDYQTELYYFDNDEIFAK